MGSTVAPWTPRSSSGTFQLHCCFEGQVSPADTLESVFLPEYLKISWTPDTGTCLPTALPRRWAWGQPSAPGDRGRPAPVLLLSTEITAVLGRNVVPRRITAPATASSMMEWCSAGHRHGTNAPSPQQRTQWLQSVSLHTARRVGRVFLGPPSHDPAEPGS